MPSLKVIKADKDAKDLIKKIEDRLIIIKESDNSGKLYFDYDDNNRIEIQSNQTVYKAFISIINNNIFLGAIQTIDGDYVKHANIGSLITDNDGNIGVITGVNKTGNNMNVLTIKPIYVNNPLTWNDYFNEETK